MPEDKGKIAVGVGLVGLVGLGAYLLTRKAKAKPPPPPPGLANLYGVVTDADTGKKIKDVTVTLNGYSAITNTDGYYQFTNLEPDSYIAQIYKEGYLTEVF